MQDYITKNQVLFLAGLTAFLYLCGLVYLQGYLTYWGVEDTLFNLPLERIIYLGFLGTAPWWIQPIAYILMISASILAFTFFHAADLRSLDGWLKKRKGERLGNELPGATQNAVPLRSFSNRVLSKGIIAALLFGAVMGFVYLADGQGFKAAEQQNSLYLKGEEPKVHLYHRRLGEIEGYPLICADSFCAFWHDKVVSVLPQSDILRMERAVQIDAD